MEQKLHRIHISENNLTMTSDSSGVKINGTNGNIYHIDENDELYINRISS